MFALVITVHALLMKTHTKNIIQNIPLLLVVIFSGMIVFNRCANPGMPTGGPKDSIPPFLVETSPDMRGLNFSGKEVRLTFNEFIVPDAVTEELVVSPPLEKRPSVRTKSKTLIVAFNEELKSGMTYSLDFKNSVVDNNERNPLTGLRFLFSTGKAIDTLRVAGMVKRGDNLEPQEKTVVMLYSNLNDTAVYLSKPDYIAKTNKEGLFLFDNVRPGQYHLFALNDGNSNLRYDTGAEEFAFSDSLISPSALFVAEPDTLAVGADSLLISGHTLFRPPPVYLRTFTEKFYEQYLDKAIRDSRYKCTFVFGESVKDSFGVTLLDGKAENWYMIESNPEKDSLTFWVTDTLIAARDTLKMRVSYFQLDSLKRKFVALDTLRLVYTEKEKTETRRKKKEEEIPEIVQFSFNENIKSSGFDLNNDILLTAPEPVKNFDFSKIKISLADDTTNAPLKITVSKDSSAWRTYRISFPVEANTAYKLVVDSAACENIYGITSRKMNKSFTTQKDDYYGKIILILSSVELPLLVELLENSKDEKVLKTIPTAKNGQVSFDFLEPSKYKVRIVFDANGNGMWDPGVYEKRQQPERVSYLPEIIKVRSNWDKRFEWDLKPDPTYRKMLIDKEEIELQQKKLREQQRKENETPTPEYDNSGTQFRLPGR